MAKQQLHSALAPIDILTREELEATQQKGMDAMLRDRFRGMDFIKIPAQFAQGNGGAVQLNTGGMTDPYCGPESGDFWMLVRAVVVSSAYSTDAAKYVLFRGGTPSDSANSLSSRYLLDGQAYSGGTLGQNQGIAYAPGQKKIYFEPGDQLYAQVFATTIGNTYILTGEAVRVPAEMKGKIL
jgi:hypothetical protein